MLPSVSNIGGRTYLVLFFLQSHCDVSELVRPSQPLVNDSFAVFGPLIKLVRGHVLDSFHPCSQYQVQGPGRKGGLEAFQPSLSTRVLPSILSKLRT